MITLPTPHHPDRIHRVYNQGGTDEGEADRVGAGKQFAVSDESS